MYKEIKNTPGEERKEGQPRSEVRGPWGTEAIREATGSVMPDARHTEAFLLYCKFLYHFQEKAPSFYNDKF